MAVFAGSPKLKEIKDIGSFAFIKDLSKNIGEVHLTAFAAALAYGAVFATVPTLALLVMLLGVFNATGLVAATIAELQPVLPADAMSLIREQLLEVATTNSPEKFGFGAILAALVALWGASGAVRRIMDALNMVHDVEETRGFLRKTLTSILLALGVIAMLIFTIAVIVLGGDMASRVFNIIGFGETAEMLWTWLRWPVLLALIWLGIATIYRIGPAARQTGGIATPGTVIAVGGWVLFSIAFSIYVATIGDQSATWGSVAGIIVFLLYLQYTGLIILLGALIDVTLFDRAHPKVESARETDQIATKGKGKSLKNSDDEQGAQQLGEEPRSAPTKAKGDGKGRRQPSARARGESTSRSPGHSGTADADAEAPTRGKVLVLGTIAALMQKVSRKLFHRQSA